MRGDRQAKVQPPPAPWRAVPSLHVGGLTDVGFAEKDGQELLLVASHNGRGVFDLDGHRIARDYEEQPGDWHDIPGLTAEGIGPLAGVRVPVAGLWGGGFPRVTRDDWSVAHEHDGQVILYSPEGDGTLIHHETFFDVRAVGFSSTGKTLVIATAGDCWLFTRA